MCYDLKYIYDGIYIELVNFYIMIVFELFILKSVINIVNSLLNMLNF